MVITLVLQGVEDVVEVVRLRKSWIGEEMLSEASLDDDELDLVVLLKQQGFTLILVVFANDFDDSDEVLDLVITKVWFWSLREGIVMVMVWFEVL